MRESHAKCVIICRSVKSYACSTCGKMFVRACNLKVHERIHK